MNKLNNLFREKTFYFVAFLAIAIAATSFNGSCNKISSFLVLNRMHNLFLDNFFIGLTFLGDGIFSIITAILILILLKQPRLSLTIIVAYLLSGVLAQVLKRIFIAPRPREIINNSIYRNFIDGITGVGWDSFPSGHTTSVFALATVLALHTNRKDQGIIFLVIAILVGYSRIYLGQHFLPDVIAGAVLGTCIGVIVYAIIRTGNKVLGNKVTSTKKEESKQSYSSTLAGN